MAEELKINNVVIVEFYYGSVFPFGYDMSVRGKMARVVTYQGGEFVEARYCVDDSYGADLIYYVLNISYVDNVEEKIKEYENLLKQKRINESKAEGNSVGALIGDTIEVYKGRKYSAGTRFVVEREYVYRNAYGKLVAYYWVDNKGRKVNQLNTIIVE